MAETQHDLKALDSDLDNKTNLIDGVWLISPMPKFSVKLKHIDSGRSGWDSGFRQVLVPLSEIVSQNLFSVKSRFNPSIAFGWTNFNANFALGRIYLGACQTLQHTAHLANVQFGAPKGNMQSARRRKDASPHLPLAPLPGCNIIQVILLSPGACTGYFIIETWRLMR